MASRPGLPGDQDKAAFVRSILGRDDGGGIPPTRNPALGGPGMAPAGMAGSPGGPGAGGQPDGDTGGGQSGIGDGMLSPDQAGYRPDGLNCGNCEAFQGPNTPCLKVAAPIVPTGFCNVHSELVGGDQGGGQAGPEADDAEDEAEDTEDEGGGGSEDAGTGPEVADDDE